MRFWLGLLLAALGAWPHVRLLAEPPPVEFGLDEFRQALAARKARIRIRTEITSAAPESYRIAGGTISGGDLRGLMYGLLAAADQIREYARLGPESGKPAVPIRGIRRFLHNADLEEDWYHSRDYWRAYIRMLARNRFNRLNLVFAHQTNYLAPPYPYLLAVDEFPDVRVPGLDSVGRERNLATLCFIAQTAADHAVDFTWGVWQHDIQHGRQEPVVVGLTDRDLGPYTYQALRKVLAACPAIRSVQVRTNWESGIPPERQVEFYRDYVYRALGEAGRLVTLDLRGWLMSEGMLRAATESGVPMRLSSKYWAEHFGRPYQPAETYPNYSYLNFLRRRPGPGNSRVRPYGFFWEIWALGSHRLLLWGDPGYVRRIVPTLTLSDTVGFEIDEPLAQKGYGNRPGKWGVFAESERRRQTWKWDFERYWLFYRLWGRITYDPKVSDRAWMSAMKQRFGAAAGHVLEAYRQASGVLNEIVAFHMPDPNMYMWPEINPGGLIDYYVASPPGERRFVAGIAEAVTDELSGRASAKQTPADTARKLDRLAGAIEAALAAAREHLTPGHAEWLAIEPDFQVAALLARFHARRQAAAVALARFGETSERETIRRARSEAQAALDIWKRLADLTGGLYPAEMAFGPEDTGHWKDKLPYLEHDARTLEERERLLDRFGTFEHGFDFGAKPEAGRGRIATSVEPRFRPVDPTSVYDDERGYGWVTQGEREAVALAEARPEIVRATERRPDGLPSNALFGDSIRGHGPQVFRIRTGDGAFQVSLLAPNGDATPKDAAARSGVVDVEFPAGPWQIAGLIVKNTHPVSIVRRVRSETPARPAMAHTAPRTVPAGQPLALGLRIAPGAAQTVRLHYRPLNALEPFRTLEARAGGATFTIPAEEVSAEWDLLYYFEVLHGSGGGWFHPDPEKATPFYVVEVSPAASGKR